VQHKGFFYQLTWAAPQAPRGGHRLSKTDLSPTTLHLADGTARSAVLYEHRNSVISLPLCTTRPPLRFDPLGLRLGVRRITRWVMAQWLIERLGIASSSSTILEARPAAI